MAETAYGATLVQNAATTAWIVYESVSANTIDSRLTLIAPSYVGPDSLLASQPSRSSVARASAGVSGSLNTSDPG